MADEVSDKVGLGVDLVGGAETLAMLKSIRAEMTAITQLSGGRGGGTTPSSEAIDLRAREKVFGESNKRIAEDRVRIEKRASQEEVQIMARAANAKADIERRVRDQRARLRADEEAAYKKSLEERTQRIRAAAQQEGIIERNLEADRRRFRAVRNDPAARNDPTTQRFRRQLAEDVQAQRLAVREQKRLAEESIAIRQQELAKFREVTQAKAREQDILDRNLDSDRRRFRRYRNDPARDEQTNQFRRQLAEDLQAQRIAQREQRRIDAEQAVIDNKKRVDAEARAQRQIRQAEIERRASDPNILNRSLYAPIQSKFRSGGAQLQEDYELNVAAQKLAKRRQQDALDQAQWEKEQAAKKARSAEQRRQFEFDMAIKGRQFQIEDSVARLQNTASKRAADQAALGKLNQGQATSHVDVYRDISKRRQESLDLVRSLSNARTEAFNQNAPKTQLVALEAEQKKAIALYQQLTAAESKFFSKAQGGGFGGGGFVPPGGRGPSGGGRGPQRPRFGDPDAVINPSGFFTSLDAVSRITRNILLYEVVSRASYALTGYIANSITAAKTTIEYANALRFATQQSGGNVAENLKLADSLGGIGLSRQQGRKAVVEAARFAENRPQDTGRLLNVVTNIAAERGDGIDRADELVEQLRRRESKFYKRIFGKTVESIYAEEAGRVVDRRTTNVGDNPNLYQGLKPNEFKSRSEQIKEYVANMDDLSKENAVFNYILSQESKFSGEAEVRAQTLAGRLDKLNAAFQNGQEGLGLFITDLKLFGTILDTVTSKAKFLDSLRGPTLGRSGSGGTISNEDVEQFGTQTAYGSRARALRTVDTALPLLAGGAVALGGLAFLGRRGAQAGAQADVYDKAFQRAIQNNYTEAAAATEAAFKAQNTRATIGQQIKSGLNRVTNNVAARVNETLYTAADAVGAERIASGAARRAGQLRGQIGVVGETPPPGIQAARAGGAAIGGAFGAYGGAVIASFVADKITSNEIIATGITILGGAVGGAVGTAVGSAAGGALGLAARLAPGGAGVFGVGGSAGYGGLAGAALPASLLAAAVVTGLGAAHIIERIGTGAFGGSGLTASEAEQAREAEFARGAAYRQQVKERQALQEEGRIRYRSTAAGGPTGLLTGTEVAARGDAIGNQKGGLLNYVEVILPPLSAAEKSINEFTKAHDDAIKQINANANLPDEIKKTRIAALDSELKQNIEDAKSPEWAKFREEYRARQAESIAKRLEADRKEAEKERNEFLQQLGTALGKLRDFEQGSFRIVGDVATSAVGQDNQYVKVLADQLTAAERMRQQWGFLGDAAVEYFTKIEEGAAKRQLTKLEYETYQSATNLRNRAFKEGIERQSPGLSRREQEFVDIRGLQIQSVTQFASLRRQLDEVLNVRVNPLDRLRGTVANLQATTGFGAVKELGGAIEGFSAGARTATFVDAKGNTITTILDSGRSNQYRQYANRQGELAGQSPAVRGQIQEQYADALLEVLGEFSPEQIRAAGYGPAYQQAIAAKAGGIDRRIGEAQEKARLNAIEDDRLAQQLAQDERFRKRQLESGGDPLAIGRASDALLLARTEGISPKDLTLQQFTARQDALRRQADREERDKNDAKAAVERAETQRKFLVEYVKAIRDNLLTGNKGVLVQVQNDTQARVDQENLQELATGKYNVPLDQSQTKTNPYSDSFTRYKRGGRK